MADKKEKPAILKVVEELFVDNDQIPNKALNRVVVYRHAVLRKGICSPLPPDQYIGRRTFMFAGVAQNTPFGPLPFQGTEDLTCRISPNEKNETTANSFEEALDPDIFDAAMNPVLEQATPHIMQMLAQRAVQQEEHRRRAQNDPNHLASPKDGPAFQQAAAVAKAAEGTFKKTKSGLLVP